MTTRYTAHARLRMHVRAVSEDEVELVRTDPDVRYVDERGSIVLTRYIAGRRIKVVLAPDDPDLVITVGD